MSYHYRRYKRRPRKRRSLVIYRNRFRYKRRMKPYFRLKIGKPELKFCDENAAGTVNDTTGTIHNLGQIATGTGDNSRIGDSIRLFSWNVNIDFAKNVDDATLTVIMLRWNDSVAPAIGDILQNVDTLGHLNKVNTKKIRVLRRAHVYCHDNKPRTHLRLRYKYKYGSRLHFNASTGTSQDLWCLYLVMLSDLSANLPNFTYISRVRFTDK